MIKVILGITIVCFTSFCGYVFSKKYRQRKNFFYSFSEFNERFLNEIAYYRRPVKEFIATYECKGEFGDLLSAYVESLDGGKKKGLPQYSFLTKDEAAFLDGYFPMLGKGDSASQRAYFSAQKSTLESYTKKSGEDSKKYGELYLKLGFLLGLLILILIL